MKTSYNLKKYNYKFYNGELIVYSKRPSKEEVISDWVEKMNNLYYDDDYVSVITENAVTIAFDNRNMESGIAICHSNDEFNEDLGTAIAYARLRKHHIPTEVFWK